MSSLSKFFGMALVVGGLLTAAPVWAAAPASGDACNELGATKMASNGAAILACLLKTPATGALSDCAAGGGCLWQYMSGTLQKSGKAYSVPFSSIVNYHSACTNSYIHSADNGGWGYMVCAAACSRFCRDGCSTGATACAGAFHNYADKPAGDRIIYTGGVLSEWNTTANVAGCFCYY